MEHHGQSVPAGEGELGAEQLDLCLTRAVVGRLHEVEPGFADRLHAAALQLAGEPVERGGIGLGSIPRVDARRAQLDAAARRAVGVDVDENRVHMDKDTKSREQKQARLHFAEREYFRRGQKYKF